MISPLQKFKDEKDLTYSDLCKIFEVSPSLIYKNLQGTNRSLSPQIKGVLAELQGIDPEELEVEYQKFKEQDRTRLINC